MFGPEDGDPTMAVVLHPSSSWTFPPFDRTAITRAEVHFLAPPPNVFGLVTKTSVDVTDLDFVEVTPLQSFSLNIGDANWSEGGQWSVRLPALDIGACLEEGLCMNDDACGACSPTTVETPDMVNPPRVECPAGWAMPTRQGVRWCLPWQDEPPSCGADEVAFVGDTDCHPIGPECPANGWPDDVPQNAKYVSLQGSDDTGSGTTNAPYRTLAVALARPPLGTPIVLGPGTHALNGPLGDAELIGSCAAGTLLGDVSIVGRVKLSRLTVGRVDVARGAYAEVTQVRIQTAGQQPLRIEGEAELRDLSVTASGAPAIGVHEGARLTANRVSVRAGSGNGIVAARSQMTLSDVRVTGRDFGILAVGSTVAIERTLIEGCDGPSIRADTGSQATISQVAIVATLGETHAAISAFDTDTVAQLDGVWLYNNVGGGLVVSSSASMTATDVVSVDAAPLSGGSASVLRATVDATGTFERVQILAPQKPSVRVSDDAFARFKDLHIEDGTASTHAILMFRQTLDGLLAGRGAFERVYIANTPRAIDAVPGVADIRHLHVEAPVDPEPCDKPVVWLTQESSLRRSLIEADHSAAIWFEANYTGVSESATVQNLTVRATAIPTCSHLPRSTSAGRRTLRSRTSTSRTPVGRRSTSRGIALHSGTRAFTRAPSVSRSVKTS